MPVPPRRTVQLEVRVLSARGLASIKGEAEPLSSCASVSLLGAEPVESELIGDTCEPTFDLTATASFHADDTSCKLLLTTPLSVSIFEGAEKQPLGSASVSLEPLMQAAGLPETWFALSTAEGVMAGEVLVAIGASAALMSEEDWEESTMFSVSLDSLHKLPERWVDGCESEGDHIFSYTVEGSFLDIPFAFPGGKLALPPPPAAPAESADGDATDAPIAAPAEAPAPSADPQADAELAAVSIVWEGACLTQFLGPEATNALRKKLQAGESPFALSIKREVKNAETHFDSNAAKYAATCMPLPSGLLAIDTTHFIDRATIAPAHPPEEPVEPPEVGKGKGPEILPIEEEDEVHPYTTSGTYLKIVLDSTRPLEPKPLTPPPPLPKVGELVPKRVLPQFAPKTAVEEFDTQVANIVESMVSEWSALFPELDTSTASDEASKDDRRRALLYALNTSGKYWMFKERLKRSVVRLVKDTMSRPTSEPLDSRASELFYNDLYVKLTQRLHKALNHIFFPPTEAPPAPSVPEQPESAEIAIVLGALAVEMEAVSAYEQAATYHKERIASAKHNAGVWYDYALFLMRTNDAPMAEEVSREAIALSPTTAEYLFAHGAILASRGNLEHAEVFLKAALDATPNSTDSWLAIALLYDLMGRPRDQRTATKQARQLHGDDLTGAYLVLARKLTPINAAVLIERALQIEEELAGGVTGEMHICRGEMQLFTQASQAAETLSTGLEVARKSAHGHVLLGQALLKLGKEAEGREALERALTLSPQPYPLVALLLLGQASLDAGLYQRAKEVFLYACRQSPSCTSWLGVGVACQSLGSLDEAEEALAEANVLNNRHPMVWGRLALLCLQQDRTDEAMQALREAYKQGLSDAALLSLLSEALLGSGKWQDAEGAARRSLSTTQTALATKLLADALLEEQRHEDAVAAYKIALSLPDASPSLLEHCKANASHILQTILNRPDEAEQLWTCG